MIDVSLIPEPKNIVNPIKKNGNTDDIVNSILDLDKKYNYKELDKFSQQFRGITGLKRLWKFVRNEITYKRDSFEESLHLTPPALWKKKSGDCKSKTLFINAVLKNLKIPYITRFTNYDKNDQYVKHVYSVAIIDNKEIPIDSVYHIFGKEKKYNLKKDYPMANIYEISGINNRKCQTIKSNIDDDIIKHRKEVKQRQKYVPEQEPILFSKITESQAILQIAKRELQLIATFKDEKKDLCAKGIELINKALKGDYSCTGNIPNSLSNVVNKIKGAEKYQNTRANGFGYNEQKVNELTAKKVKCKQTNRVNSLPNVVSFEKALTCLRSFDYNAYTNDLQTQGQVPKKASALQNKYLGRTSSQLATFDPFDLVGIGANTLASNQLCSNTSSYPVFGSMNQQIPSGSNTAFFTPPCPFEYNPTGQTASTTFSGTTITSNMSNYNWKWREVLYFKYGINSRFRVTLDEALSNYGLFGAFWGLNQNNTITGNTQFNFPNGLLSGQVNTQADFDLAIQELNASSGVMDKFLNWSFSDQDAGIGNGLFYLFTQMTGININSLPPSVIAKLSVQTQYADATQYFSSVSQSSIYGLSRNNILYTQGGEQPEDTLQYLQSIYTGQAGVNIDPAVITMIIGAIIAVIELVVFLVDKYAETDDDAQQIDTSAYTQSQFSTMGAGNMMSDSDWYPSATDQYGNTIPSPYGSGSNGSGSTNSNLFLLGGLGLGAFLLTQENDKKGKKKAKKRK